MTNPNQSDALLPERDIAAEIDRIKQHVWRYAVPERDARRTYTVAQLETAIRLALQSPTEDEGVTKDAYMRACRALHWRTAELRANGIEPIEIDTHAPHYPPVNFDFKATLDQIIPNSDPVETAGEVVTSVDGALTEALRAIEDGEGDAQVIARQTLEQLGIATLEEGR